MPKMNFLNQDPRFPTDAERNEEFPRNIYLKRNIDYVTKLPQKKRAPGAHLQSAYPGVIDLYASIQNAISEGWLSLGDAALDLSSPLEYEDDFSDEFTDNDLVSKLYVDTAISEIDLSGSGIYSGSGNIHPTAYAQLAADTTFSLGRLTSSGAFSYSAGNKESGIQFNTSTGSMVLGTSDASGTGSINVILMGGGTPLGYLYQTPTIQGLLNFNGGVALGYGEVSNANQTQINLTGTQISFSGYNASTAFSYVMPRVTPASDGSTYFLG